MSEYNNVTHIQKVTGIGGTEQFFLPLGEGLTDRGWNCSFVLLHEPDQTLDDYRTSLRNHGWHVIPVEIPRHLSFSAYQNIRTHLRELKPDILHTHLIHGDLYGRIGSNGLDVKRVTSKHNDDQFKRTTGYDWFARWLNRGFDSGITISNHLREFYERELNVRHPPFETIHYGLDPDEFLTEDTSLPTGARDWSDAHFVFGIVARLIEQKGHTDLIEAFGTLRKQRSDVHLVIVGSGPLEDELISMVADRSLEDSVTFTGFRRDVADLMSSFDVFVHPSRWEGFGLVFLEAMASRLPIVATNVSAIPEIVRDGDTGVLVAPDDPDALHEAMSRLANNPEYARELGESGYRRLESEFSLDRMVDAHELHYQRLLKSNQSTHPDDERKS